MTGEYTALDSVQGIGKLTYGHGAVKRSSSWQAEGSRCGGDGRAWLFLVLLVARAKQARTN
jgi:hypothetical protein